MMDRDSYIEDLLKRFFEGQTSNAEEQHLYRFFADEDIPEQLLQYKPVFDYFTTGLEEELTEAATTVSRAKRPNRLLWVAVAAVSLALVLLRPLYNKQSFDPYEGSYIVRNGVRITDPEVIRPELEATLWQVSQQEEQVKYWEVKSHENDNRFMAVEEQIQEQYNDILTRIAVYPELNSCESLVLFLSFSICVPTDFIIL